MLAPIGMMALVDQMSAQASDYVVTAMVPAPLPIEAPVITSPRNDTIVTTQELVVQGVCPVVSPAVLITIYENDVLLGSTVCGSDGTFTVPVSLTLGTHTIQAKVLTITGQTGASSDSIRVTYKLPSVSGTNNQGKKQDIQNTTGIDGIGFPVRIVPAAPYVVIGSDGQAVWRGSFHDGSLPYTVTVDWGDGQKDSYNVGDASEQSLAHHYGSMTTYTVIIKATDARGGTATLYSVVITYRTQQSLGLGVESQISSASPFVRFIEQHIWHIYIITLSSLVFLWYIEHGRHLAMQTVLVAKKRSRKQKSR